MIGFKILILSIGPAFFITCNYSQVMVRLMLTLTPCVCILSGIAFSKLFELYLKEEDPLNGNGKKVTAGTNEFEINIRDRESKLIYTKYIILLL